MHIVCSKEKLIKNTNLALRAVSQRTTLPILECILLEANTLFKITGNDLEMAVETSPIEATIIEEGSTAINAKIFFDIIRKLPDEDIIIKVEKERTVYIKSGKVEFKIMAHSPDEFPTLPAIEKLKSYAVNSKNLKNMIRQTIFSVSNSDDKPQLTGGLLEIEDNNLTIVAVDSFRISLRKEELIEKGENLSVIVPGKTLNEVSKILPNDENINLYFDEKHIIFEMKEGFIVSRLLEGEFLRYKQVLEQEHSTSIFVNQKDILNSLERSTLITSDLKRNPVTLSIDKNKMIITSQAETGNLYDELEIQVQGKPLEISFNPKYLIDAIKVIELETIKILFNTNKSPCIIMASGVDNYKYLVLPLRPN